MISCNKLFFRGQSFSLGAGRTVGAVKGREAAERKSPALGGALELHRYDRQHACANNFASLHYGELLNPDFLRVPHRVK